MAEAITKESTEEMYFLGAAKPQERGVAGRLGAVQCGCEITFGSFVAEIFKIISSIVTDETNVNSEKKLACGNYLKNFYNPLIQKFFNAYLKYGVQPTGTFSIFLFSL